jgi:predicted dehydrogenase
MGRRRVRNLRQLGVGDVRGFDARADRREQAHRELGLICTDTFEAGLDWRPEVVVVSTPPDDHVSFALAAVDRGIPVFTELSLNPDGLDELRRRAGAGGTLVAPSCTARFNPVIGQIRSLLVDGAIGTPTNVVAYLGQYLPSWHPWEDYRQFFAARRRTGACRELLGFDLLWLPWVLGPVAEVGCMRAALGSLESDIDDVYQVLLRFGGGTLASLQIDAVSRVPVRYYRFVSDAGVIVWDWTTLYLRAYTVADGKWKEYSASEGFAGYSTEDVYTAEMGAFVAAVRGEATFPYTLEEDLARVELMSTIDASADRRELVAIMEGQRT